MYILFTRNSSPASCLIRELTQEPVSHCGLLVDGYILHVNFKGLVIEPIENFTSEIVYRVPITHDCSKLLRMLCKYKDVMYDFGGMFYIGLRILFPWMEKANLWQSSGMFICTEWVTEYLGEQDSMITPYKLYLRLSSEGDTK